MQECVCCTMTSLCCDMACLSRALWQSHTCSTYAKGLTKPEIHQSAFSAHRHTHRWETHAHTCRDTHTQCWCGTVYVWSRVAPLRTLDELGCDMKVWHVSKCFICFDLLAVWITSQKTTQQAKNICCSQKNSQSNWKLNFLKYLVSRDILLKKEIMLALCCRCEQLVLSVKVVLSYLFLGNCDGIFHYFINLKINNLIKNKN